MNKQIKFGEIPRGPRNKQHPTKLKPIITIQTKTHRSTTTFPRTHGHTHQVQKPTGHLKHHYGDKSQVDAMHQQTTVKTSNEIKLSERTLAFRRTIHKTPRCKPPCDVRTTMYHCQTPGTTNSPTRSTKTRTQHVSFTWNVDVHKHTHAHKRKIYSPQYTNNLNQTTPRSKQVTTSTPVVSAHDTKHFIHRTDTRTTLCACIPPPNGPLKPLVN